MIHSHWSDWDVELPGKLLGKHFSYFTNLNTCLCLVLRITCMVWKPYAVNVLQVNTWTMGEFKKNNIMFHLFNKFGRMFMYVVPFILATPFNLEFWNFDIPCLMWASKNCFWNFRKIDFWTVSLLTFSTFL